jgi:CheY-like chemotaxis protein
MRRERKEALLVDDSPLTRIFVERVLLQEGYYVRHAGDGLEGLEALEEKPVDLLVVDFEMPHLNGADFLADRRARGLSMDADVIFSTASAGVPTPTDAYRLAKPIDPRDLVLLLREIQGRRGE